MLFRLVKVEEVRVALAPAVGDDQEVGKGLIVYLHERILRLQNDVLNYFGLFLVNLDLVEVD